MTKVSILTPTLNAMEYIEECIQSVLDQDYQNIEHVIADAGSTDGTFEYLLELSKRFPHRVRVIKSINDKGVGDGLNTALRNSSGSIIGWLDADDMLEINSISKIVAVFANSNQTNFIYGECTIIDSSSRPIGEFVIRDFDKWEWVNRWHYIIFCGAYFRREVVEKVGFLNSLGNDLDFYLRVAKKFTLQRVDFGIARWRYHNSSISHEDSPRSTKIRYNRAKEDFFLILKNRGSLFSPKSINFILVFGKKYRNNKVLQKIGELLKVKRIKSVLVYNISNSNIYITSKQSFFITILKIVLSKFNLINRIIFLMRRTLGKVGYLAKPIIWCVLLLDFLSLELSFQRRLRKRKKFYGN